MAKRLNTLNFVYTAVGLAVAGGIGYYVYRRLQERRALGDGSATTGFGTQGNQVDESLMDLRRASRKAGRATKDTAKQVGKTLKRGASDIGESFADANSAGRELVAGSSESYER